MIQVIVMERMAIMARNGGEAQAGVGVEVSLPERNCGNIAATANHDLAGLFSIRDIWRLRLNSPVTKSKCLSKGFLLESVFPNCL
jgi:hypothetical protein